jgi:polysaccharide biosynthesis/export protein
MNTFSVFDQLFRKAVYILSISMLLASCVSQRNVVYLQDKDEYVKEFNQAEVEDYKLKPNDELYIQISSLDEASTNIFSTSSAQQSSSVVSMQPYGASLASYAINKEGYLLFPVIGNILVKDKTLPEVSAIIRDSLTNILSQPLVSVKLVNRYISVLGEVRNPGHFAFAQEKLTIFDALALAGDITDYGDRSEVILARNENGKNIRINVNLTKSGLLASQYYFLRPNDLIYVKPLKKRFWGLKEFPFSIVLSTISTALLLYTVVTK